MTTIDILRIATEVTYIGCFVVAVRSYARSRSEQARWLVTVFASIAAVIVVSMVRGPDADPLPEPWTRLLVMVLLAFPWALFRLAGALAGMRAGLRRTGDIASGILLAMSVLPGVLSTDQEAALTGLQVAYLTVFLTVWGGETVTAAVLLWRARRGQSQVVRRRLRLLAIATFTIGLALFASAGSDSDRDADSTDEERTLGEVAGQGLGALSGVLFLIGFAPPRLLRAAWRHDDERKLYDIAVGFITATSAEEVVQRLLPGIRAVLGAPAVALLDDDGHAVAVDGTTDTDWVDEARRLRLHDRELAVRTSTRMPLIGEDEEELIDRMGLLTALATDRAQLIVSERQARARAEEANRKLAALNEELEAFLYSTSHDLKNPVIALVGYVDLLRTEYLDELPPEAARYLDRLDANSRQIEMLINDLLELSRVGRVESPASPVDLNEVIDGLVEDLTQRLVGLRITRGELPRVMMSPQRATQMFGNLLENAGHYGGRDDIHVHVDADVDAERDVVQLRVADDGVGIPGGQAERIFGMFERLNPEVAGGTGMGLAICRRIVEHLGGTIDVEPADRGATFLIQLPTALLVVGEAASTEPVETS